MSRLLYGLRTKNSSATAVFGNAFWSNWELELRRVCGRRRRRSRGKALVQVDAGNAAQRELDQAQEEFEDQVFGKRRFARERVEFAKPGYHGVSQFPEVLEFLRREPTRETASRQTGVRGQRIDHVSMQLCNADQTLRPTQFEVQSLDVIGGKVPVSGGRLRFVKRAVDAPVVVHVLEGQPAPRLENPTLRRPHQLQQAFPPKTKRSSVEEQQVGVEQSTREKPVDVLGLDNVQFCRSVRCSRWYEKSSGSPLATAA